MSKIELNKRSQWNWMKYDNKNQRGSKLSIMCFLHHIKLGGVFFWFYIYWFELRAPFSDLEPILEHKQ